MRGTQIASVGAAVPDQVLDNAQLASDFGVSEDWIVERCGIQTRRIASAEETVVSLGALAAFRALTAAGVSAADVDLLICATISAERRFPAAACEIASLLDCDAPAYDVNAGCSGFLFGLAQGAAAISAGSAARVLVVGSDVLSRFIDPQDAGTAILFGDGAGAALLEVSDVDALGPFVLRSDGSRSELLYQDERGLISMRGREVYRWAVEGMTSAVTDLLDSYGPAAADVDLVVAHQANQRIIDAVGERLGLRPEQVYSNIARYGNTSAGSIPLALVDAVEEGRLRVGDSVVLTAFGAGFCWGATSLRWCAPAGRPEATVTKVNAGV